MHVPIHFQNWHVSIRLQRFQCTLCQKFLFSSKDAVIFKYWGQSFETPYQIKTNSFWSRIQLANDFLFKRQLHQIVIVCVFYSLLYLSSTTVLAAIDVLLYTFMYDYWGRLISFFPVFIFYFFSLEQGQSDDCTILYMCTSSFRCDLYRFDLWSLQLWLK